MPEKHNWPYIAGKAPVWARGFLVLNTALDVGSFSVLVLSSLLFYLLYLRVHLIPHTKAKAV